MSALSLQFAEKLLDACRAGASEAAAALSSVLEGPLQIADVANRSPLSAGGLDAQLQCPGLAVVFHASEQAAALLVPDDTRLIPDWCTAPDVPGEAKLQKMADWLARLMLPADVACTRSAAGVVAHLADALRRATPAEPCGHLALSAKTRDREAVLHLVWPLAHGDRLLAAQAANDEAAARSAADDASTQSHQPPPEDCLALLPGYSRSLLSIHVPIVVTLARTQRKVSDILRLGPGAIIQFDKSCEDTLELEAGGQTIAEGEAVKVGEKFGLRITAIRLPEERFEPVGK